MIDNAFDLPIPEFDRLGNQPMFIYEQSVVESKSVNYGSVIGWKELLLGGSVHLIRCSCILCLLFRSGFYSCG